MTTMTETEPNWTTFTAPFTETNPSLARAYLLGSQASWAEWTNEWTTLVTPSTQASRRAIGLRISHKGTPFLICDGTHVVTMHGCSETLELNDQGGIYTTFRGDFRQVAGQSLAPGLCRPHNLNSRQAYRDSWETSSINAQTWDNMAAAHDADDALQFVAPCTAVDGEDAADQTPAINAHIQLPVNAMLGALFLTPKTPRQAFKIGGDLRALIPPDQHATFDPLFNFLRAAATQAADNPAASGHVSTWDPITIDPGADLETNYATRVGHLRDQANAPHGHSEPPAGSTRSPSTPETPPAPDGPATAKDKKHTDFQLRRLWSVAGRPFESWPSC